MGDRREWALFFMLYWGIGKDPLLAQLRGPTAGDLDHMGLLDSTGSVAAFSQRQAVQLRLWTEVYESITPI